MCLCVPICSMYTLVRHFSCVSKRLCECVSFVCLLLFLNTSCVSPLSQMGQQVSRSLARTLLVRFDPTGCLGRVVSHHNLSHFIQQHFSLLGSMFCPSFSVYSNDMNKCSLMSLIIHWLYFSSSFYTLSHVLCVYSSVFGLISPADQVKEGSFVLIWLLWEGPSTSGPLKVWSFHHFFLHL